MGRSDPCEVGEASIRQNKKRVSLPQSASGCAAVANNSCILATVADIAGSERMAKGSGTKVIYLYSDLEEDCSRSKFVPFGDFAKAPKMILSAPAEVLKRKPLRGIVIYCVRADSRMCAPKADFEHSALELYWRSYLALMGGDSLTIHFKPLADFLGK